jgi:hypothetical protein
MKTTLALMIAAVVGVAAGCGNSDSGCGDGGCLDSSVNPYPDGGSAYDGPTPYALTRGTTSFKISGVSAVTSDTCGFKPGEVVGDMLTVTYDETTQTVTIGKPVGTPATPFFGSGKVAATTVNTATLMRENDTGTGTGCTWHEKVTSTFQLYANDKFTLTPVLTDSNYSATCTATDKPGGATCMSTWTWTIEK